VTRLAHQQPSAPDELQELARGTFGVLAPVTDVERANPVAQLGQALFWDPRLSVNGRIACASCHVAKDGGADRRRFSVDAKDRPTQRHSQTVFNATLQPKLRWIADRQSAAEQAEKSLTGSMGFRDAAEVLPLLEQHGYAARFETAFPHAEQPLTTGHYAEAIAAYEQTLRTPSVFDQYLEGQADVLSEAQGRGLQTFLEIGCADCHAGPLLGGEQLQRFGVYRDYWLATGSERRDAGRFASTQEPLDRNVFRVPMLRNIAETAPYFHDGSVAELEQAVRIMAELQLGLELTAAQIGDLVAFLQSLSGEVPANYRDPRQVAR
jgi:cytochrome c peroxidase